MKKKLFKRPVLYVGLALIVITGSYFGFKSGAPIFNDISVVLGTVIQQVRVTGQFKPAESVELGFERAGRVVRVAYDVGDEVAAGSVLVILDQSELSAQLAQVRATVSAQQSKLNELKRGTRPESITISESKVQSAEVSADEARHSFGDAIRDAYAKTNDAIRSKVDTFFLNPQTLPQLQFSVSDSQVKVNLEAGRIEMERRLNAWAAALFSISSVSDLMPIDVITQGNLSFARDFLSTAALALNNVTAGGSLTQTTIDGWRANVSSGLTAVSTAISTLSTGREGYKYALSALKIVKNEFILVKAGATTEEIAAQEAQVEQAEANVLTIEAQISKTIIRSPIKGVVTLQNAKIGQIIPPNVTIVSVISQNDLEIEANVPEVDIGKIKTGNNVVFTVDALPNEEFHGALSHIDPAETVVGGVANFKIKISLSNPESRFKSGLTANITIETLKKENVLVLPQYAVLETDAGTFVRVANDGITKEIPVKLGVRSEDGLVEILSGILEGDSVMNVGLKNGSK